LSSLGWAAEFPLRLLDTTVVLRVDTGEAADGVGRLLAPFIIGDAGEIPDRNCLALVDGDATGIEARAGLLLAYRNGKVLGGGDTWADSFGSLMTALNRQVIEEYLGFALHAGVVAKQGRAIAFPADSGGGKSTLTAACIQQGFDYVSDESLCIALDTAGVVRYPKPLGLSRWSRERLGIDGATLAFPPDRMEGMVIPNDLGGSVAQNPIVLSHVVIPAYGDGRLALEEAPGHEAMAVLLEYSFNHFKHGASAFTLAGRLANQVTAWRLSYDDPLAAARLISDRLG